MAMVVSREPLHPANSLQGCTLPTSLQGTCILLLSLLCDENNKRKQTYICDVMCVVCFPLFITQGKLALSFLSSRCRLVVVSLSSLCLRVHFVVIHCSRTLITPPIVLYRRESLCCSGRKSNTRVYNSFLRTMRTTHTHTRLHAYTNRHTHTHTRMHAYTNRQNLYSLYTRFCGTEPSVCLVHAR